jgi:hypothetical protein
MKSAAERVQHIIELKPEICSLDMGSMNMGAACLREYSGYLEKMGRRDPRRWRAAELEVFETGHLLLAKRMIESGHIKAAGMFQILPRLSPGRSRRRRGDDLYAQPPAAEFAVVRLRHFLHQFPMVAQACWHGHAIRGGLETTSYLERGKLRPATPRGGEGGKDHRDPRRHVAPRPTDRAAILGLAPARQLVGVARAGHGNASGRDRIGRIRAESIDGASRSMAQGTMWRGPSGSCARRLRPSRLAGSDRNSSPSSRLWSR